MPGPLTEADVEGFHEDGYVFLPGFFDDVEELRAEADRILELVINSSLSTGRKSGRLVYVRRPDGVHVVRKVDPVLDLSKPLTDVATEDVVAPIRQLLDDEPVLLERTAQLNYKEPLFEPPGGLEATAGEDRFPVHSDWAYYEGSFPPGVITPIVFLDDVGEDSGPVQVWPGTHTEDLEHESVDIGLEVPPDAIDHDAGEPVTGPAGSLLLFDSRLIHSSEPNTSGRPRRLLILGHAPASNLGAVRTSDVSDGIVRAGGGYPKELREARYESEYRRLTALGEYEDRFTAPTFD